MLPSRRNTGLPRCVPVGATTILGDPRPGGSHHPPPSRRHRAKIRQPEAGDEPGCVAPRRRGARLAAHRLLVSRSRSSSPVRIGRWIVYRLIPSLRPIALLPRPSSRQCPSSIHVSRPITGAFGRAWRLQDPWSGRPAPRARASPCAMQPSDLHPPDPSDLPHRKAPGHRGTRTTLPRHAVQPAAHLWRRYRSACGGTGGDPNRQIVGPLCRSSSVSESAISQQAPGRGQSIRWIFDRNR